MRQCVDSFNASIRGSAKRLTALGLCLWVGGVKVFNLFLLGCLACTMSVWFLFGAIGVEKAGLALILFTIIATWILAFLTYIFFSKRAEKKKAKAIALARKQQENRKQQRLKFADQVAPRIVSKLKVGQFATLSQSERNYMINIVEMTTNDSGELLPNELALTQAAMTDTATYNFLTLRNAKLAARNQQEMLQKVSSRLSSAKVANIATGLAAAKYLGESMGDD